MDDSLERLSLVVTRARTRVCVALLASGVALGCGDGASRPTPQQSADVSPAADPTLALARQLAAPEPVLARLLTKDEHHALVRDQDAFVSSSWRDAGVDRLRRVSARLPARSRDAFRVGLGRVERFGLGISLDGARDVEGSVHDGAVVYRSAFPSTDVIWATTDDRAEELLVVRGSDAPREFAWRVDLPRGIGSVHPDGFGALVFADRRGDSVLRVPAPFVVDAHGARRAAALAWQSGRVSVRIDPHGLAYPLLVDPAVEVVIWEKMTPKTTKPGPRLGHAMAYDSGRGLTLLFGGTNYSVNFPDTWGWDGVDWTLIDSTTSPARGAIAMAYDSVADASLMFGSCSAETWQLSGSTWSMLTTTKAPTSRRFEAMAYDGPPSAGGRGKIVLFGGHQCVTPEEDVGDTWEWDGSDWTPLSPSPSPDGRESHTMVYETGRHVTLLFGGIGAGMCCGGNNDCMRGDTWTWDGTQWDKKLPAKSPDGRYAHAMAYDSIRNRTVLYGGNNCPYLEDTWEWDGTTWADVTPSTGPGLRQYHAMAFDPARGRVVMFGGQGPTGFLDDTWEYHTHGAACGSDTECDTGHCVDGVCCEQSSCGSCEACDTVAQPGQCAPVLNAQDDSCNGAKACDSTGICKTFQGQPCATTCPTGLFCVDGVCCDTACAGTCEACDVTNQVGVCSAVKGPPHGTRTACASDGSQCGGNCNGVVRGACTFPDTTTTCRAASCTSGVATAAANCDGAGFCGSLQTSSCGLYACATTSCESSCSGDAQCGSDAFCAAPACTLKLDNGSKCARAAQCKSDNCVDGYCCDSGCSGQCEACDVTGSEGTCTAVSGVPHGRTACTDDGSGCGGVCDGSTRTSCTYDSTKQCRAPSCSGGVATVEALCDGGGSCPPLQTLPCAPFQCGPTQCAGCANDGECASTEYCLAGLCKPKLALGASCAGVSQCQSGFCVDQRCCDRACDGQCEACDVGSLGTCGTLTSGAPHGTRTRCAGTGSCAGSCDGSSATACAYPNGTQCAAGFCSSGTETTPSRCDDTGVCVAGTSQSCGTYTCGAGACKKSCSVGPDCSVGDWCQNGQCVPVAAGGAGGAGGASSGGAGTAGTTQGGSAGAPTQGGSGGSPATGGSGASTSQAGNSSVDAGPGGSESDAGVTPAKQASGCGCRTSAPAPQGNPLAWLGFVAIFAVCARRHSQQRE